MSYLVLARKYRPQTFDDLVGQDHVVKTLTNALEAKRLGHAYIFSGSRGCGKTTTARLLAKALNCVKGPTPKPCGECGPCKEIASGASPDDVLEIDGASNRGIDQIRELRDTVKYAPARSRYRIIIIDEAHQITDAGFNALLKTLEEPPAHAVFMMATTELQKFPATILSRCQRFTLRPIPPALILERLEKILKHEKISAEPEALAEVAKAAQGSLRDALSLLDQVIAYADGGVKAQDVRALLGLLPRETVKNFAAALYDGTPEKTLQAVQKAVEDGVDLFQLGRDLLDRWHQVLLWKSGVTSPHAPDAKELEAEAAQADAADLERKIQTLLRGTEGMRRSESPRVTFELAALEIAQKSVPVDELLDRLEALERNLHNGAPPAEPAVKKNSEPAPFSLKTPAAVPPPVVAITPPLQEKAPAPAETALLRPDQFRTAWAHLLEEIGQKKPSLESFLLNTRWVIGGGGGVELHCADDFQKQHLAAQVPLLRELLVKYLPPALAAGNFSVTCLKVDAPFPPAQRPASARSATPVAPAEDEAEVAENDSSDEEETPPAPDPAPGRVVAEERAAEAAPVAPGDVDPAVKKVMTIFPGKLKKILPKA